MTEEETRGTSMVSMSQSQFLSESNKQLSEVMARFNKPVRLIFEASSPTTQCFNTVGPCLPRNMGEPEEQGCKCWICGLPIYLLNDGTEYLNTQSKNKIKDGIKSLQKAKQFSDNIIPPHCEHILPVMTATFVLGGLYDADFYKLPEKIQQAIARNYLYAHPVCNLVKKNHVYINDDGAVDLRLIGKEIDNIFMNDPRSLVLNEANKKKYDKIYPSYYQLKGNGLAKMSTGYKEFRTERVTEIASKLQEVLRDYQFQIQNELFGLLLLSGVVIARENIDKFVDRVRINQDVIDQKVAALSRQTQSKKVKQQMAKMIESQSENRAFLTALEGVIGSVNKAVDVVEPIPTEKLLASSPTLQETIKMLNDSVINTKASDIVNQLSLMNQQWLLQMLRPAKKISSVEIGQINGFLNRLFEVSDINQIVNIKRGMVYGEGIPASSVQDAMKKLIEIVITLPKIQSIISEFQGKFILQSFGHSDNTELPIVQAYEYIISLIQTAYLILLIERYNGILLPLQSNPGISPYLELVQNGRDMLQQNLYDSLISLYLKQTNYKIKCITSDILHEQLLSINGQDLLTNITRTMGQWADKSIQVPDLDSQTGEVKTLPMSIKDIISRTIPGPDNPYCNAPNQAEADKLIPPSVELFRRTSSRIQQQREKEDITENLNELYDEELDDIAQDVAPMGGKKKKKSRRKTVKKKMKKAKKTRKRKAKNHKKK